MISYYADVMEDGVVRGCFSYVAPPTEGWAPQVEGEMMPLNEPIDWSAAPSATAVLRRINGFLMWVDSRTPAEIAAQARQAKSQDINDACRKHIELGFHCDALGAPFLYPAKAQDQANLVASVTDSLLAGDDPDWTTPFWCADEAGEWEYRLHTVAQIRKVGREGKAAIVAALQRNEALQRQIAAASVEQLESIIW